LTNVTPDHLDRYDGQVEKYMKSKFRLFINQKSNDFALFYKEDMISKSGIKEAKIRAKKHFISLNADNNAAAFPQDDELVAKVNKEEIRIPKEVFPLAGKHNLINALFAISAAKMAGLSQAQIEAGLQSFKNAPHRLEKVADIEGVSYINDSKGTNVEATAYALESYKQGVIWIAGGVDKGNDYSSLYPLMGRVKALICLGKDNAKLQKAFTGRIDEIRETQNIKEAITWSHELAQKGDVVLLSPACASFDLFKNYEDRGDQFRAGVLDLKMNISA
jgi:UDP-N-acetylmuramoylalanine--D-glutamate ligase